MSGDARAAVLAGLVARRSDGSAACVAAAACALAAAAGCKRDPALGPPDSFVVVAPVPPRGRRRGREASPASRWSTHGRRWTIRTPRRCTSSSRWGSPPRCCAPTTWPSSCVRDIEVGGRRYPDGAARRRASRRSWSWAAPGRRPDDRRGASRSRGSFGGEDEHAGRRWRSRSTPTRTTTARCRRRWRAPRDWLAASRVAAASAPNAAHPLVIGYARALEVIAREWRVGEGPAGAMPADAGTAAQRELFAAVRENRYALARRRGAAPGAPSCWPTRAWRPPSSTGWRSRRRVGREDRARRGLRAVREGPGPRGRQPGRRARAVPELPGEAALGLGARRARRASRRATSPISSTPTGARCRRSARRSSASSSSRLTARTVKAGRRAPAAGQPGRGAARADGAGGRGRRRQAVARTPRSTPLSRRAARRVSVASTGAVLW